MIRTENKGWVERVLYGPPLTTEEIRHIAEMADILEDSDDYANQLHRISDLLVINKELNTQIMVRNRLIKELEARVATC